MLLIKEKFLSSSIFCFLFLLCFGLMVRFVHLPNWYKHGSLYFYNSNPLMTTVDAYYYLRLSKELLSGKYLPHDNISPIGTRPTPPPLLVSITSGLKRILPVSLEKIAFYLPVVLSMLILLPYFFWSRELGDNLVFVLSGLIGVGSFYWYSRTCLGRFDTDSLIPVFIYLLPYLSYKFTFESKWEKRFLYIGACGLISILFSLWWWPAKGLVLPLIVFPYTLTLFDKRLKTSKIEQGVKVGILVVGLIFIIVFLLNWKSYFPSFMQGIFVKMKAVFDLISKKPSGGTLPNISISISELLRPSWGFVATKVSGLWLNLILAGIGLLFLVWYKTRVAIFLSVPFFLAGLTIFGKRFLIYLIPIYALSWGFFVYFALNFLCKRFSNKRKEVFIGSTIFIVILVGANCYNSFKNTIFPSFNSEQVAILEPIINKKDKRVVWTWWDYGYVVSYFAHRPVMIDGGSQSPLKTYIVAAPFVFRDFQLASNWIKFFAAHRESGIYEVGKWLHTKDYYKIFEFLKSALRSKAQALQKYHFLKDKNKLAYLFPQVHVYLYLPFTMYLSAHWWYYYGSWNFIVQEGIYPTVYKLPPIEIHLNLAKGVIVIGNRKIKIKRFAMVENNNWLRREYAFGDFGVFIDGKKQGYYFDQDFANSVFAKLLSFNPKSSSYFKLLKYNPKEGGLWEIS